MAACRVDRNSGLGPAGAGKARANEMLIRPLARAHRWERLLDRGSYRSAGELAEAEGVTRSFVNRLLRLTLLAPDIAEAILDGRQPKGLQLEGFTKPLPSAWEEQQHRFTFERFGKSEPRPLTDDPTSCG